jgi:hypothetical protein
MQYIAEAKYHTLAQKDGQSLEDYKNQFLEAVANMRHVNCPHIPPDDLQARHFFMKLHPKNLEFKVHVKNKEDTQFPRTIQQVVEQCERFVTPSSLGTIKGQPMVYSTDVRELKKSTACNNCGKI